MLVTSTNEVGGGYVFGSVCVCVGRFTAKLIRQFYWNLSYDWAYQWKEFSFDGHPVLHTDSESLFHFPHRCGIGPFREIY